MVDLLDKKTKKLMAIGSVYLEAEPIENLVIRTENAVNYTTFRVNQYEDGRMTALCERWICFRDGKSYELHAD